MYGEMAKAQRSQARGLDRHKVPVTSREAFVEFQKVEQERRTRIIRRTASRPTELFG
jgi:hypothetical protein